MYVESGKRSSSGNWRPWCTLCCCAGRNHNSCGKAAARSPCCRSRYILRRHIGAIPQRPSSRSLVDSPPMGYAPFCAFNLFFFSRKSSLFGGGGTIGRVYIYVLFGTWEGRSLWSRRDKIFLGWSAFAWRVGCGQWCGPMFRTRLHGTRNSKEGRWE